MAPAKLSTWNDESSNHSMEFTTDPTNESNLPDQEEDHNSNKSENTADTNEQPQPMEYYQKLGDVIKKYEGVIQPDPPDENSTY